MKICSNYHGDKFGGINAFIIHSAIAALTVFLVGTFQYTGATLMAFHLIYGLFICVLLLHERFYYLEYIIHLIMCVLITQSKLCICTYYYCHLISIIRYDQYCQYICFSHESSLRSLIACFNILDLFLDSYLDLINTSPEPYF